MVEKTMQILAVSDAHLYPSNSSPCPALCEAVILEYGTRKRIAARSEQCEKATPSCSGGAARRRKMMTVEEGHAEVTAAASMQVSGAVCVHGFTTFLFLRQYSHTLR